MRATGRALDHIIETLEGLVTSDSLWEHVAFPSPRDAPRPDESSPPHDERSAPSQNEPDPRQKDEAEVLASRAEECIDPRTPPAAASRRRHGRRGEAPTRRVQILDLLEGDPTRWWPAQELSTAIGVARHRTIRGLLSEMCRDGEIVKLKESATIPASYRLAPAPSSARQKETAMSG